MQKTFLYSALLLTLGVIAVAQKLEAPPTWAFVVAGPEYKQPVDDGTQRHVPNSTAGWTLTQLRDPFFAPDWHPEEHPAMPEVVARGRKPDVYACGFCHRADGSGGPENANLAGLPEAYIVQQMADFKSGARKSAVSEHLPSVAMAAIGKAAREEEVASAAGYFSGLQPRKLITVVEANEVPKTYVAGWVFSPRNGKDREPIGMRIIEMPRDLEQFESRDTHSEFIAYVPVSSIAKGEALATTGGNVKTLPCGNCHGANLRGLGPVPGIAGRSPSYLARQIYEMKLGARAGVGSKMMTSVVAELKEEDIVALAAYAASLKP